MPSNLNGVVSIWRKDFQVGRNPPNKQANKQTKTQINLFVCLFRVFRSTWEFYTYFETSPLPMKAIGFWPMLGTCGHWAWVFFSVSHILWHGKSFYNGLRGLMTLIPFCERFAVELSLPNLMTYVCCCLDSNYQPSACGANALTYDAIAAAPKLINCKHATMHRTFLKNVNHTFAIYNQDCWVDYS